MDASPSWRHAPLDLEAIVSSIPLAAALFDTEMRYLAHNDRWLPAHGEAADRRLVGLSHYDVFPNMPPSWKDVHVRCLSGATERSELDVLKGSDGTEQHLRWVVTPLLVGTDIRGLAIYAENVTEHEGTRRRLAERECLIRDFFEKSPIGLNLCTMDGLWLESNPAFLDIIGYGRSEADGGITYWQLTPSKYEEAEKEQLEILRTQHRYGPYEKEFTRKDGSLVPVRLNGFLIERDGEKFIWSLIEDMTAQRELEVRVEEERLKAIQASKLATLGEMAAGIAHEIRNPLGIIDGFAFALNAAIERGDASASHEAIHGIRSAAARASAIVDGLRKFARISDSTVEEVHVKDAILEGLTLCGSRIATEGVELRLDIDTASRVRVQSIEFGQVLVNLVTNAFDAVRSSPAKWVAVSVRESDDLVEVLVDDSGPGVPKGTEHEVFKAFYTTKRIGEGTGLGLSISKSIAERHGGSLSYDSMASHSRFVLRLPRAV